MRKGGLEAARQTYINRQTKIEEPDGAWLNNDNSQYYTCENNIIQCWTNYHFDENEMKYYKDDDYHIIQALSVAEYRANSMYGPYKYAWEPLPSEYAPCCERFKTGSHPEHIHWDHCRSALHIANLYGVDISEVYQAHYAVDMIKQINASPKSNVVSDGSGDWLR